MSVYILVVDDEPDVEALFRQQFRRDLRSGRFTMEFAPSAAAAWELCTSAGCRMVELEAGHFFLDSHRSELIREIGRDLAPRLV